MCPSKFRRKYHLVRHLSSKHGIIVPPTPPTVKSTQAKVTVKKEPSESKELTMTNLLMNNFDKFSVEALMMKQDNNYPSPLSGQEYSPLNDTDVSMAQLGLQQTFQNLKNLFVNYSLNNVSN
jgi:hypothetical protein